jgi:TnpA family transposase
LRTHANSAASIDELLKAAQHWLHEHKILIPGDRALRDLARDASEGVKQHAIRAIKKAVPLAQRESCRKIVFTVRPDQTVTVLEWLQTPPRRHSPSTLEETLKKVSFLKECGVQKWDIDAIPFAWQQAYARALASRPPSESKRRKDETQLLEVICFLRITLLDLTDSVLYQTGRRIGDFARRASERTESRQALRSGDYRQTLVDIKSLVHDESKSHEERLQLIDAIVEAIGDLSPNSHAAMVREALTDDPTRIKALLKAVSDLEFEGHANEPAVQQLAIVRDMQKRGESALPEGTAVPASSLWRNILEGEDRVRAGNALLASTALALRRGLRRGSVWVGHSLTYRERERMLIPKDEWERDRSIHLSALGLSEDPDAYLNPRLELLKAGLEAVNEAVKDGAATIDAQGLLHLPAITPLPEEVEPERLKATIFNRIGNVQLPALMVETDALSNYSEVLLGHKPQDVDELIALYAGLLALGTDADAKTIAAMTPQLKPGHVSDAMRALESPSRMTDAIHRVVDFQAKHAIVKLWGNGELASSDMMSLDASRHLLNARIDPRRRTYAVGMYTHVLNNHGIIHHLPRPLFERQVGPAIEGVLHQNQRPGVTRLKQLAVDTHGYTNVGMALSDLSRFSLCPRLSDLPARVFYLPRAIDVPEGLGHLAVQDISLRPIRKHWDEVVRVVASMVSGRTSATVMLQRLGSAAQGDPVHRAADQLGRLLRTIFLCDYFSIPDFRRELHAVLNRGESVHQLQRCVYAGRIAPQRGRRRDELTAISGAHTLLTNLVIAWNTHHMQLTIDDLRKHGVEIEDSWIARMGPAHFRHINFRGLFNFGVDEYRESLLAVRRSGVGRTVR